MFFFLIIQACILTPRVEFRVSKREVVSLEDTAAATLGSLLA